MEQMNKPLDDNQTMDINADADIPEKHRPILTRQMNRN